MSFNTFKLDEISMCEPLVQVGLRIFEEVRLQQRAAMRMRRCMSYLIAARHVRLPEDPAARCDQLLPKARDVVL
jgi:hypothetical protein